MAHNIPSNRRISSLIRENKYIRVKVLISVLVIAALMALGYHEGQLRPAFPDLIEITNVDLERGSSIITSYVSGRLVGAGLGGILLSKFNPYLLFVVPLVVDSGIVAAIPWCSVYELMVAAHALHGTLLGVLNIAITTTSMQLWRSTSRGRTYILILYLFYEISLGLAPIATAPFLQENVNNITTTFLSGNDTSINDTKLPSSSQDADPPESTLYIAYVISAGMGIVVSIPFLILFLTKNATASIRNENERKTCSFLNSSSKVGNKLQFINIGMFSGIFTVVDLCYPQYLTVFCVQYLNWTKTSGALVTSVFSFSRLGGKIVGIFLVRVIKSHSTLLLASLLDTLGFACLTVSAFSFADFGIWISACITGLAISIMWPTILSWVNAYLIPVEGKVASYLLMVGFFVGLITPIALGHLMQEVSLLWFCYICLIASVMNIINIVFMIIHTKLYDKKCNTYTLEVYTLQSTKQDENGTVSSTL